MTTPYTYIIGWTLHNKWYYGRQTKNGCHPSHLWVSYFTSSKEVAKMRREHGEPDVVQVRKICTTPSQARKWEERVLRVLDAARSTNWLNKRNGDTSDSFNTAGCANAKTMDGDYIGSVLLSDPRWSTGEIVGVMKGVIPSTETKQKQSATRKNTAVALLPDGTRKRIPLDDPRWASGEIVGMRKGSAYGQQSTEHKQKRADAVRGTKRSDEAKAAWSSTRKGKKPAYDNTGSFIGLVDITDPRWGVDIFTKH